MKLSNLTMHKAVAKDSLVDVSAAMVHAVPDLQSTASVWKSSLDAVQHLPGSIKLPNARILSYIRNAKTTRDLPSTVLGLLPTIGTNLELLSAYIISSFPAEYDDKTATVKQKVTMAYLGLFYRLSIYLPDLVTVQLNVLSSLMRGGELYEPPQRKTAELESGLTTFAIALDVLGVDSKTFADVYNKGYPEVESNSGVESLLAANGLENPIARVNDNFRGNPFFTIGKWANTVIVDYVKYMEDRKRVSKLYLEQLKSAQAGSGNPANDREIMLLEEDIADLEYRIYQASK